MGMLLTKDPAALKGFRSIFNGKDLTSTIINYFVI
jgi:hypothetical protein